MKKRYLQFLLPLLCVVWLLEGCGMSTISTEQDASSPPSPPSPPVTPISQSTPSPQPQEVSISTVSPQQVLPESPKAPMVVKEKPFTHTIRWQGETLARISLWYTGSMQNWQAIVEANPALDPRRMGIGDEIIIPKNLLKTRDPMTENFRSYEEIREMLLDTPLVPEKVELDEVELFGPVDSGELGSSQDNIEEALPLEGLD